MSKVVSVEFIKSKFRACSEGATRTVGERGISTGTARPGAFDSLTNRPRKVTPPGISLTLIPWIHFPAPRKSSLHAPDPLWLGNMWRDRFSHPLDCLGE